MDLTSLGLSELLIVTLTCLCIGVVGVGAFGLLIWLTSRGDKEFEQNLAEFEQSDEG